MTASGGPGSGKTALSLARHGQSRARGRAAGAPSAVVASLGSGRREGAENSYVAGRRSDGPALRGDWARDSRDGLKAGR